MFLNLTLFISSYLLLIFFIFYFYQLGNILGKKVFCEKTNISVNIIIGLGFFISAINLIYAVGLRDFKIVISLLFIHALVLFFFNFKNYKRIVFDYKLLFVLLLPIIVSLTFFKYNFLNFDDFYGYSNLYESVINNNYNFSPDLQIRAHNLSFGYTFIQSIFVFLNGISTIHFFDQTLGTILIVIYIYENFFIDSKKKNEFYFYTILIVISTISIPETSLPKIIIYSLTIIMLSETKNFFDGSKNISVLVCLLLVGFNLRYNFIISYIHLLFSIILLLKILKKKIKLNESIIKITCCFGIFLIPDLINKFIIFDTILPLFLKSKYFATENYFFKEIELIRNFDFQTYIIYWVSVFFKKNFLIIAALFGILFFSKKNLYFNRLLFFCYFISIIVTSFILFPDRFNSWRYLWPLENALIIFLILQIINNKFLISYIKNYKYIFIFFFTIIVIYISLLTPKPWIFYEFYKSKFQNVINIFSISNNLSNNFFFSKKIPDKNTVTQYKIEFNSCFDVFKKEKDVLTILNYSYLMQEKKLKKMEINTGFLYSKDFFPFFQSFDEKSNFLKNNYEGIIIEKILIYKNAKLDQDLKELDQRLKEKKINLTGLYPNYSKYDIINLLTWLDFVSFLKKIKFSNKVNCETDNFISFKF
jgi:hypothetical protein